MDYNGGLVIRGSRQHLYGFSEWRHLDKGEAKLRELFPKLTIHTSLDRTRRKAILTLWAFNPERPNHEFVEPIDVFPSDHMIAQIMLVTG